MPEQDAIRYQKGSYSRPEGGAPEPTGTIEYTLEPEGLGAGPTSAEAAPAAAAGGARCAACPEVRTGYGL